MPASKIQIYPTRVEAVNKCGDLMFNLETFDEHTCKLDMNGLIGPNNLDDVLDAIRRGVAMLELDKPEDDDHA